MTGRPAQLGVRGARGSHPPSHPRPPCRGRPRRSGPRGPVPDVAACDLPAPEGARGRRPHLPQPPGNRPAQPPRAGAAARGHRRGSRATRPSGTSASTASTRCSPRSSARHSQEGSRPWARRRSPRPEGQPFIDMEREFDAPRELVHRAYLEPELVDPVARATQVRDGDRQVGRPRRRRVPLRPHVTARASTASTACSTRWPSTTWSRPSSTRARPVTSRSTPRSIEDLGNGRSRIKSHSVFMSVADRDAMVEAGMGSGVEDGYNRLDELLVRLQPVGASR